MTPTSRREALRSRRLIASVVAALILGACGGADPAAAGPAADEGAGAALKGGGGARTEEPTAEAKRPKSGPAPAEAPPPAEEEPIVAEPVPAPAEEEPIVAEPVPAPAEEGPVSEEPALLEEQPAAHPAATLAFAAAAGDDLQAPPAELALIDTAEVHVVAGWTGVTAELSQRIDVFAPNGALYTSAVIAFAGTTRADASVEPGGDGSYRVRLTLQVAGTPIETYWMTGEWRATVSLEGSPVAASASVVLR